MADPFDGLRQAPWLVQPQKPGAPQQAPQQAPPGMVYVPGSGWLPLAALQQPGLLQQPGYYQPLFPTPQAPQAPPAPPGAPPAPVTTPQNPAGETFLPVAQGVQGGLRWSDSFVVAASSEAGPAYEYVIPSQGPFSLWLQYDEVSVPSLPNPPSIRLVNALGLMRQAGGSMALGGRGARIPRRGMVLRGSGQRFAMQFRNQLAAAMRLIWSFSQGESFPSSIPFALSVADLLTIEDIPNFPTQITVDSESTQSVLIVSENETVLQTVGPGSTRVLHPLASKLKLAGAGAPGDLAFGAVQAG